METRNVEITLETAKRWYEQGGEFKEMALSAFTEDELDPVGNEWNSRMLRKHIDGYVLSRDGGTNWYESEVAELADTDIFKTEKQAKSALAYAQLTQLMALPEYNGDWVPDWNDDNRKYIIRKYENGLYPYYFTTIHHHIAFKTEEIRDKFLENNLELLKEYFEFD